MILLINICKEPLHYFEFVRPVEKILRGEYFVKNILNLKQEDLDLADKIIICGTSLKDNFFLENLEKFDWLKSFEKPVFGICAGFQIIGLVFEGEKKNKTEIGFFDEDFEIGFFGMKGKNQVYHLHKNCIEFNDEFKKFTNGKIPQAVKHKEKQIYGTLFHPEVRNKEIIINFENL